MSTNSQRVAYGEQLVELGKKYNNVVVLEADLGKSTMSSLFEKEFPERFFEVGIAEQNMASIAAGFAVTDKVAFINSFAVFVTGRSFDQIRQTISIGKLNVKICGSSAGLSDFGDGSTHQSIEDIAIMRSIPNMTVLVPMDSVETKKMVEAAYHHEGPVYIRVNRNDLPIYKKEDEEFTIGKLYTIREGKDVVVFANGVMISIAMEAAEILAKENIDIKIINVSTIKKLDRQAVVDSCKSCKGVVTAEEHSVIGGLGSSITEALRMEKNIAIEFVGVQDSYGTSASNYQDLLTHYGLTSQAIVDAVKKVMK